MLMRNLNRPYSEIVGMTGLRAYAIDAAVVRWGSAFQAAVDSAGNGAKTQAEAESKTAGVVRRWVPSTRRYR